jgi:hypothetical protein
LKRLLLLISLALGTQALAADRTADATAKFLAGLPVKGTPLESHAKDPGWAEHASNFSDAWGRLEKEQLSKIRAWAPKALGSSYQDRGTMYYMFSGPDFLYANLFFPNASTYILCGIEPVGPVPDIDKMPSADLAPALEGLRNSLSSVLNEGYFTAKKIRTDFKQTQLDGTLPIFYVFLARAGCTIDSVAPVALDGDGKLVAEGQGTTPGVKIVFSNPSKRTQTLYYFTSNLMDKPIKANPSFMKFCEQQGQGLSLLKAACYYMGTSPNNFTTVRDFLLAHSKLLLQDESGIRYSLFEPAKWDVRLFAKPHAEKTKPDRLEFSFGYTEAICSSVMVARPK